MMSKTVTIEATAEPLIIRMTSLPSGRSATISACGRMTLNSTTGPAEAERHRRLALAARHGGHRAAEDLGLVGGGVEREGEDAAEEGVAEEPPQADRLEEAAELAAAVVDEEELGEQRRAAEEGDVGERDAAEDAAPRQPRERDRQREQRAERHRDHDQLDGDEEPVEHAKAVALEELGAHDRRIPRSDQRSIRAIPTDETIDIAR